MELSIFRTGGKTVLFDQQSVPRPLMQDILNPLRQFFGLVLWADREQKQIRVADLELQLGHIPSLGNNEFKSRMTELQMSSL